jgi:hypothetical protein
MRALLLAVLLSLLCAQQLALSHQLWHFGDQDQDPAQEQICCHHDALGTVAGAVDAPLVAMDGERPAQFTFQSTALPSVASAALAPSSRGPPALS